MPRNQAVRAWLTAIADDIDPTTIDVQERPRKSRARTRKRRRLTPPTPETSQSGTSSGCGMASPRQRSSEKRGRRESDNAAGDDFQQTPRASDRRFKAPRSESSCSLPSSRSQYQASDKSGYSSPSKQWNELERGAKGVIPRELSTFQNQPPSLETLLYKIDLISAGQGILPLSERETFNRLDGEAYHDWKWTRRGRMSDMHFSNERQHLGHIPPPDTVHGILYQAAFCNNSGSSEADWNTEVHHRVLEAALRPLNGPSIAQLINFRSSTTASIIPEYHVTPLPPKKVDFCIYVEPNCDKDHPHASQTIVSLQDALPSGMFNHTNLNTLRDRPIALSIETKRTGEGWDNARLQMGIWNAAHWEFLGRLLRMRREAAEELSTRRGRTPDNATEGGRTELLDVSSARTLQLPDYLPGIIIQGHDWHLVITTRHGDKTIFWQKMTFGTTSSSKGIYQIICALQLLQQWAREEYWAWLRVVVSDWPSLHGQPVTR
ncbi:hypothetical protein NHJ13051_009101 [Beauveria bassiana]